MEMEVAVEKNQRAKAFSFSPPQSREVSSDALLTSGRSGGDGHTTTKEKQNSPAKALPHKLPPMLKIAVIGDSTAGKTVICEAFCKKNFTPVSKYSMTCGVRIYGKCITASALNAHENEENHSKGDEKVNLILLDSAGKDLYREYLPKYWEKLDAVALVIDLTSPIALEFASTWMELVEPSLTSRFAGQAKKIGTLIGNKIDLKDGRVISYEEAKVFADSHNLEYFECSVRNNSGFEEPFHFLAREWFEFQQSRPAGRSSSQFKGQASAKEGSRRTGQV